MKYERINEVSEKKWKAINSEVSMAMREHVRHFTTPISRVTSLDHGALEGSASYFSINETYYLITNEHVATKSKRFRLAHQLNDCDNVFAFKHDFLTCESPVDVAITKIDFEVWQSASHTSKAIPLARFAHKHSPVPQELLFLAGYSGQNSKFIFDNLINRGTPYLTQEMPELPEEYNHPNYFSLFYNSENAETADGRRPGLPDPHGFSGSLVWNTRYVEFLRRSKPWSPECAEVTGILWGWPSRHSCLLATKVEKLRGFIEQWCSQIP